MKKKKEAVVENSALNIPFELYNQKVQLKVANY